MTNTRRSILSLTIALGLATAAHADTVYTFTRSTTIGDKITATGSFSADQAGTNLPTSVITNWNIDFTGGGLLNLKLNPSNSTLTFQPGTVIDAALDLSIIAPTSTAGFTLDGTATEGTDTFIVEWVFGDGPAEIMTIGVPDGSQIATGATLLTYPSTFTTNSVGATSPTPEPSSLLLLGTGSLSLAAGLRRMRSVAATK
jgi:PEP-CTERM motif